MAGMPKAPKPKMPKPGGKPKVSRKGGLKETSPTTPDLTGAPVNGMGPGVLSAATQALAGTTAAPSAPQSTVQAKPFGSFKGPKTVKVKKPKVSMQ
jgi:hypothetical protein